MVPSSAPAAGQCPVQQLYRCITLHRGHNQTNLARSQHQLHDNASQAMQHFTETSVISICWHNRQLGGHQAHELAADGK
jgi:hypothetical protein